MTDTPTPTSSMPDPANMIDHLDPLSTERALLAIDVLTGVLEEVSRLQEEGQAWAARVGEERALNVTESEAKTLGLDVSLHDFTTGPYRLAQPPDQREVVAHVWPEAWRTMRSEVVRLAAILLTPNAEFEGAWTSAGEDGYDAAVATILSARELEVRFRWHPAQVARLIFTVVNSNREEFLQSMGEGRALVAALRGAGADEPASPNGRASAPATPRASRPRSGGRRK